jgi:NADH dehydrogenase
VVILGAGSGGLSTALSLKGSAAKMRGVEVTLVDRKNYHPILPLAYQVVTGSVAPGHISVPLRKLLGRPGKAGAIKFRKGLVQSVDVENRTVATDAGDIGWDYLVVALGSTTNFFGISGIESVALPFRSVKDGIEVHNRIIENFEAAVAAESEQRQRELLTFVVIGGGPTGVELSAQIREFTDRVLAKWYPEVARLTKVVLVEAQNAVLATMKPRTQRLAVAKLQARGVELRLGTRITEAWPGGVQTSDGDTIATDTVVWTAGIKPVSEVATMPFEKAKDGRILVNEHLQVPGLDGVYALGDCAFLEQGKGLGPYPPTFQVAFRQGRVCAKNITNSIKGKPQGRYGYRFLGQVYYMDRNVAVAELFGLVFDGYVAGIMRRALFLGMLISYGGFRAGFRSKVSAAVDWTFAYFYRRNTARIE